MSTKNGSLFITIEYQSINKNKQILNLEEKEYFDETELDSITIESIPRYDHAYQYLDISKKELLYTKLNIVYEKQIISINETFWNEGNNFFIETHHQTEENKFTEFIIQSKIPDSHSLYEIMRFDKNENGIFPVFHVFEEEKEENPRSIKIYPQ